MLLITRRYAPAAILLALLAIAPVSPVAAEDVGFGFRDLPGAQLDVTYDGKTIARYMYAYDPARLQDTYKPYLHVLDAEGKQPITKGPGGQYTHHRAIFIGFNRLSLDGKSYDLWHMSGGTQVHQKFIEQEAGREQARFTSLVHWKTKDGRTLIEEERSFLFHAVPAPALISVDVTSTLKAIEGDIVLSGDPEHAGVQYRPADEVDRKQTRYLFPADGNDPRKDKDLPWVAETYVLNGEKYSVVQFNYPDNPKQTVWSAYRDYGRLGAFPKAEIAKGETITLKYRFCVMTGDLPPREQIVKMYGP
ncbi:MAG: PmoA family protein [Planctomycetes bacterium]|nr:PmoA family protein [Planctomycetota bacterium]